MGGPQQNEFLIEARERLTEVCDQLIRLERAAGEEAISRVEQIFRAVHSIKGGAGFFGLRVVEQLAHRMESLLEAIQGGTVATGSAVVDLLLAATDRLTALLDDVENSNSANTTRILSEMDAILAGETPGPAAEAPVDSLRIEAPVTSEPQVVPVAAPTTHEFEVSVDLSHCQSLGLSPLDVVTRAESMGRIVHGSIELEPTDSAASPPQEPIVWHATISSPLSADEFHRQWGLPPAPSMQPTPGPAKDRTEAAAPSAAETATETAPAPARATIRIPVDLVDRLMTLAGELVLVRNQSRRFSDQDQPIPGPVMQRLNAVTSEFQETVLQTRMQPVAHLFNKFPRLVRDLGRQLGKQIELRISGAEVELDKTIIDALSDPLTHLVRNACDHGLETSDERVRAGKPAGGTLHLSARHFGDQIWIAIEDDGRGIDRDRVRAKALQQGLRTEEELAKLDDREILSLILLPGFSTAAKVTDVSGRGVGMDVVKTNLTRLGGGIEIDSRHGSGTTFILRLPLTLAIIPTLLVTVGDQRFAIPQKDLEELIFVGAEQSQVQLESTPEGEMLRLRGRLLPLLQLRSLLSRSHWEPSKPAADEDHPPLVAVVRAGTRRFGLVVDRILTSEEIVVKPMHSSLRRLAMYSGATILGDGRIALILSAEGIARSSRIRFHADADDRPSASLVASTNGQRVLCVTLLDGDPMAVPLTRVQRIVMVSPRQIERVAGEPFVLIDQSPVRLVVPRGEIPPADHPPLFVVLPRKSTEPLGWIVREIIGTEEIAADASHRDATGRTTVLIAGKITEVAGYFPALSESESATDDDDEYASRHVLLVDDTQFFRDVVGQFLAENGYDVMTVNDGKAALAALVAKEFDIVVSDLEMPTMDGWTLARNVRRDPRYQHLPMVALTTLSGPEAVARSVAAGFDAHEVKLDRDALLATVRRLLTSAALLAGGAT